MEAKLMRNEYDFRNGRANPYAKKLKRQITINLCDEVVDYFKDLANETGVSYQSLINLYLLDCVKHKKKLRFN